MAANIKGISIEFGGETTGLGKALADVDSKARSVQSELKQVEKLLKLDPSNTQLVAQKQELLKEAVSNTTEKLERLKAAQAQVQAQFDKGEITQEQYRAFQREIQKTEQDLQKLETTGKKSMDEIGKGLDNAGQKMTGAGRSLTQNVTVPILAAGAAGVKLGMSLDDALDNIQIKTGTTGAAFQGLKDDFNAVAPKVSSNFEDISNAIADLNVRLDLTGKPLQEMAIQVLNLSEMTGTDLKSNLELVGTAFQAFNVDAADYSSSLDLAFRTTQETGISIDELLGNMQTFGPVLQELGFGFNESAALLGTLKKNGADVEQTMASMKKAFVTFAKEGVTDGKEALRLLLEQIKAAPNDMEAGRLAVETFGAKAGASMGPNIRAGRLNIQDLLATIEGGTGTINGTKDATDDWLENLRKLWNHIQIEIQPAIEKLWESLNKLVPTIAKIAEKIVGFIASFSDLSPNVQTGILAFVGFMAAIGPVLVVVGTLVSLIGKIVGAFSAASAAIEGAGGIMAVLTGPWGIAIAVVAALAAAAFLIYKNWAKIKEAVQPVVEMFKTYVVPVLQEVWAVIKGSLVAALDNLKQAWGNLLPVLQPLLPYLKMIGVAFLIAIVGPIVISIAAILAVVVALSKFVQGITWVIAQVAWFAANFKTIIGNAWTAVKTFFIDGINTIVNFFTALPGRILTIVTTFFGTTLPTAIGTGLGTAARFVVDFIESVVAFFVALPGRIQSFLQMVCDFIVNTFVSAKDSAVASGQSLVEQVVAFFSNLPGQIAGFLSGLSDTISSAFRSAAEWAQNALYSIVEYAFGLPGRLYDAAARMGQALWDGIKGFFKDIAEGFQKAFRGESSPGFVEVFKGELDKVSSLYDGFLKGFPTAPLRPDFGFAGGQMVTRPAQSLMAEQRQPTTVFIQGQPAGNNQGDINIAATVNNPADAVLLGRTMAFNLRTRGY